MADKKKATRHRSALKAYRQSVRRQARNRATKKSLRLAVRAACDAAAAKDPKSAGLFSQAVSVFDKAAARGVIHWKAAARKKSRLAKRLAAKPAPAAAA